MTCGLGCRLGRSWTVPTGDQDPRCGRRAGEGVPLERLEELRKKYHDVPDYSCLIR